MLQMCFVLIALVGYLATHSLADSPFDNVKTYECGVCRSVMAYSKVPGDKFENACYAHIGKTACDLLFKKSTLDEKVLINEDFCLKHGMCPMQKGEKDYSALSTDTPNIRISKALGVKGYDKVRISLITNSSISPSDFNFPDRCVLQVSFFAFLSFRFLP